MTKLHTHSPTLIISYDDGPKKDYTLAFPVHLHYGVPAEINVVSDLIGTKRFLDHRQLRELQNAGFEIVSHTKSHKVLAGTPLTRRASRGDTKIHVGKVRFEHSTCLLRENGFSEVVHIVGKGQDHRGRFAQLESGLQNDYTNQAEIRLTHAEMVKEIEESKAALVEMDLHVSNFTFPYNLFDDESRQIAANYYDSARAGGNLSINHWSSLNRYSLNSKNFIYLSQRKIIEILDETVRTKALCIFYTHTWESEFTTDKLQFLIKRAKERGIEIVTRQQALGTSLPSS